MSNVTQILQAVEDGDPQAASELLPLVYDELRNLAAAKMSQEKAGATLQATALVHEAYLKLVDSGDQNVWCNRRHFFASAALAMRRILIDRARRKNSLKRGGDWQQEPLFDLPAVTSTTPAELLDLDEALANFAKVDPVAAEIVNLRYFVGMPLSQIAKLLQLSPRTIDRNWAYARAWLHEAISGDDQ